MQCAPALAHVTTTSHRVRCEPGQQRTTAANAQSPVPACLHTAQPCCRVVLLAVHHCHHCRLQAEGSDGAVDAVMSSAPGSTGEAGGGSPTASRHMMEDSSSGGGGGADGGDTAAQPAPQQQPADATAAAAAVVHPAAAEAAGPHYPGHPPGVSLAPLAAAAAAPAAVSAGSSGGSSGRHGRQGVLSDAEAAHILGSQANLWTEYVADEATAEYMLLPRLAALAEAVW